MTAIRAGIVATVLGAVIAVQARVNGELSASAGSGLVPAWLTMTSGFLILVVIVLAPASGRRGLAEVARRGRARDLRWWVFTGGVFGSLYLIVQSVTVPLAGVAVFTVASVAGLTAGSLVVDRLGLTGTGRRAITVRRLVGAVLGVLAVGVGVSDRLDDGQATVLLAGLALVAGALIAPQQAFVGRLGVAARNPFVGALVNFTGGIIVMSLALGVALTAGVTVDQVGGAPWWAYVGGPLGVILIAGSAWTVPTLGVFVFSLLSVFGQFLGAIVLDLLAPTPGSSLGWHIYTGVAMTVIAVLIASMPRRRATA